MVRRSKHFNLRTWQICEIIHNNGVQLTPDTLINSLDEIEDPNKRAAP